MAKLRLGALEAGGTKMVCAIGDENGTIYEQVSIPTTTPKETIPKMIAYFRDKGIDALGIACFGPIELDRDSEKYGYITTTPKLAWRDCDIVGQMQEALHCPVGFDTDVNGSVLGEVTFGQAQGKKCVMYLTIGTGVGTNALLARLLGLGDKDRADAAMGNAQFLALVISLCRQVLFVLPPVWALTRLVTGPENVSLVWWPLALGEAATLVVALGLYQKRAKKRIDF